MMYFFFFLKSMTTRRYYHPLTLSITLLLLLLVITFPAQVDSFSSSSSSSSDASAASFTGVRISLYPKTTTEGQSLKQTIKDAVSGISDLGLEVRPDDCSSALLGPEPALFEATRAIFGRACKAPGQPHVSMICTFSAGCPGEEVTEAPKRMVVGADDEWIDDAYQLPSRIAAQFAVYPLGKEDYMSTIYEVINHAKKSPVFKDDIKTHFCSMLDGDGSQVFDVLRESFALARQRAGHVTMTVTLTANKSAWKNEKK